MPKFLKGIYAKKFNKKIQTIEFALKYFSNKEKMGKGYILLQSRSSTTSSKKMSHENLTLLL